MRYDGVRRIAILGICTLLSMMLCIHAACAETDLSIQDFTGCYSDGEYLTISLSFNEEGLLTFSEGHNITNVFCDYEIAGNVLTCWYDGEYDTLGERIGDAEGNCQFTMLPDGNLLVGLYLWMPETTESYTIPGWDAGTLTGVTDLDFPLGGYSGEASFLGNGKLRRSEIEEVSFLSTLEDAPEDAWDVSQMRDGSVLAWVDRSEAVCHVYIAAEGGVQANARSNDLFRHCTQLRSIHFNGCFDTGEVIDMSYMFYDCARLTELDGIEDFQTSQAARMACMFAECGSLVSLDLSGFDISGVENLSRMFLNCKSLQNLDISGFDFGMNSVYIDIFTGTRWEESSPLLDETARTRKAQYILDSEGYLEDHPALYVQVFAAYDDQLNELLWNSYLKGYLWYALVELNGDEIPELLTRENQDEQYIYRLYAYNRVTCKAEIAYSFYSESDYVDYSAESREIAYNAGDFYELITLMKDPYDEHEKLSLSALLDRRDMHKLSFNSTLPSRIAEFNFDIDWDGVDENVKIYALFTEKCYDYVAIYVDSYRVFYDDVQGRPTEARFMMFNHRGNNLIWMKLTSGSSMEDQRVFWYDGSKYVQSLCLEDMIHPAQLVAYEGLNRFEQDTSHPSNANLEIRYTLNTVTFGEDFTFMVEYEFNDGDWAQSSFLADVEKTAFEWYTLSTGLETYEKPGGNQICHSFSAGERIVPDKVFLSDGIMWVRVRDANGHSGWMPMGAQCIFLEIDYSDGATVEEQIETYRDSKIFWQLKLPDAETLYNRGGLCWMNGADDDAVIYFDLIRFTAFEYYFSARRRIQDIREVNAEECFTAVQEYLDAGDSAAARQLLIDLRPLIGEIGEYQSYLDACDVAQDGSVQPDDAHSGISQDSSEQPDDARPDTEAALEALNTDLTLQYSWLMRPLASCRIDLDGDGQDEIIVRRFNGDAPEGGEYIYDIYKFDSQQGRFICVQEEAFYSFAIEDVVYYWEDMGYLVVDDSFADICYSLFAWSNGSLQWESETSSDLSYLPMLRFAEIAADEAASNASSVEDIFVSFVRGESRDGFVWGEYQNFEYAILDLDGDGTPELVERGEDEYSYGYQFAFYRFDEASRTVQSIGTLTAEYEFLYYLPQACAFSTLFRTSSEATYQFYTLNADSLSEAFSMNRWTDKVTQWYARVESDGSETILGEIPWIGDEVCPEWKEFESALQEIVFQPIGSPAPDGDCLTPAFGKEGITMRVVNCEEWVSLRENPSVSANRLVKVPLGAVVTECAQVSDDYVRCTYAGKTGFILKKYLQ